MKNKRNLSQRVNVEIHPAADDIADVFWAMDSEEQAAFFNRLAEIHLGAMPAQLQEVSTHNELNDGGRYIMKLIGMYADSGQEAV